MTFRKWMALLLGAMLSLTACGAQADLLTQWGIPEEVAAHADVQQPDEWDGRMNKIRELLRENNPVLKDSGWIANVDEVYYDGVTAFVLYTIREIGATQSLGMPDEDGVYWLSGEEEHYASNRGVGWHEDSLFLNGQKVSMPLADEAVYGSAEPGVVKHYMKIRLDQATIALPKDDPDALALPIPYGKAQTLGLPIGDVLHLGGGELTMEQSREYALAKSWPEEMGYIFVDLNEPKIKVKTFEAGKKIGETTIERVETIITPVRLYVNVTLTPDEQAVAAQYEKDKAAFELQDLPPAFSAVAVNEAWAFGVALVDADGRKQKDMCGMFTGMMGLGANEAMYEFNLRVNSETGYPRIELPDALYLALEDENGDIDMATAIQVY